LDAPGGVHLFCEVNLILLFKKITFSQVSHTKWGKYDRWIKGNNHDLDFLDLVEKHVTMKNRVLQRYLPFQKHHQYAPITPL